MCEMTVTRYSPVRERVVLLLQSLRLQTSPYSVSWQPQNSVTASLTTWHVNIPATTEMNGATRGRRQAGACAFLRN